jgi:CO/xanthine dehydrogenase Mo-binding subunit
VSVRIGDQVHRVDAIEKVTGTAEYVFDLHRRNVLHAKILRSPVPHARVLNIDRREAESLPGVKAVVTGRDLQGIRVGAWLVDQEPYASERVRYIGDPVAGVAAVDEETALEALQLIRVDYEELPAVFDPEEAMRPGSPLIHPDLATYQWPKGVIFPEPGTNICGHLRVRQGDVGAGLENSDVVLDGRFSSPMAQHCCMEPHVSVIEVDYSGGVVIWTSAQGPHFVRQILAQAFGIPLGKIRVVVPYVGGGFGGKSSVKTEPLLLPLAMRLPGRSVRLAMTREEEFTAMINRISMKMDIKSGVNRDGRLQAREVRILWDAGAYSEYAVLVGRNASYSAAGPYEIPNIKIDGYTVYTNKCIGGPMRGFGVPETTWALEQHMDELAEAIGMDPVEFRLKNAFENGSVTATGQVLEGVGLKEAIRRAAGAIGWGRQRPKNRGIGIACMHKTTVTPTATSVALKLNEDGTITVSHSAVEMGSGAHTLIAQVVAHELGLPIDQVIVVRTPDTDVSPYDWQVAASRVTFWYGNAVRKAVADLGSQVREIASLLLEVPQSELDLENGHVLVRSEPARRLSLAQLALGAKLPSGTWKCGPVIGRGTYVSEEYEPLDPETGQSSCPTTFWMYAAQTAEVEVDPETGHVLIHRICAAHDVGKVVNPLGATTQLEGGLAMGVGSALFEEVLVRDGKVLNPSFVDYKLVTASDMPKLELMFVEEPHPEGPYGAKGLSEPPLAPTAPCIANAVYDAVGVRVRDLPMTPERVYSHLQKKRIREDDRK